MVCDKGLRSVASMARSMAARKAGHSEYCVDGTSLGCDEGSIEAANCVERLEPTSKDSQWVATKICGRLRRWLRRRLARRLQVGATLADSKVTWADALGCDEGNIEGCTDG